MGNSLVKYGSYEAEAAAEEKEQLAQSDSEFMKLAVGKNVVRFLPPPPGSRTPFVTVWQHYVEIPGASSPVVFACPKLMAKRPCPVCAKADQLRRTGNPADRDMAWELKATRRVFANVINRKEPERGPVVLAFGKTIHDALVALRADEDAGGDFTNPIEGFDIIIQRKGTGKNDTEYKVMGARNQKPLHPDAAQMNEWITMQQDLSQFAVAPNEDQIKEKFDAAKRGATGGGGGGGGGGRKQQATASRTADDDIEDAEWSDSDSDDDLGW